MTVRVAIRHKTLYRYDRPVELSPHVFRLRPAMHSRTPIKSYSLTVQPETHFLNWQQDPFGNWQARVVFPDMTRELAVEVDIVAEMTVINPFDFFLDAEVENFPWEYEPQLRADLLPYLELDEDGPLLKKWLSGVDLSKQLTTSFLFELNRRLSADINYLVRMEPGVQTCEQTLQLGQGSCRDSGWLLVQILRHLGLAARFASGYLVQLTPDEKPLDGPAGTSRDFTDLHAWAEVYVPGAGWLGLDPTSGLFAGEGHIPLACTPDPASAAPVTGATGPCEVEFSFDNSVQRIYESPRVTRPYSDGQWSAIEALGQHVDADLQAADVRLSIGGEPTFVSIDDFDGEEWNTGADGPDKRRLALDLVKRLRTTFAPGGVLQFGQGKWYPGEPVPRWQYGCYWRLDGEPVWQDTKWLADPAEAGEDGEAPELVAAAEKLALALADHLGVAQAHVAPAYEDAFYFAWSEATLPVNVDPMKANLKDSTERRALARILDHGLDEPAGYVLPLTWSRKRQGWRSASWPLTREHLFLTPGDSPMGLRLPLKSLPWVDPEERDIVEEPSPLEPREPLQPLARKRPVAAASATEPDEVRDIPHTAICVEARGGAVRVFLPPCTHLEHYLDLVNAVETAAAHTQTPVVLEGYEPPVDPRLQRFKITPDPGVIEVNIHPAYNWEQQVHITNTVYEQARLARLTSEKFQLDGLHTGTGGGNHIVIGGPSPADSPLLRRPDLLRSLVIYWQHHPALSYLFSGLFVGPTSQAPRIDEGRDERLYEAEIAFGQMPDSADGAAPPPWLADRLLRHLLVDLTGNTHRAEFCIDKLYSPESATGRLGLLELRAFEMPPHARMSLVQNLLLRALISHFWQRPYHHDLVRWGTELHDRFMLPHYVWDDMEDVIKDLRNAGYAFELSWLAPFFEFRFPRYGAITVDGIELELRRAIEPWHVLGEEVTRSGTSRFVDSSIDRLQVRVAGLTESRYVVTCNGHRLPLRSTGTHGEYVTGVRFRAWDLPSALHPTIGVHAPLVFDVVDTWNSRSLGGCTYNVAHRGGRSYETLPVNAFEAEARRTALFWDHGHTAGTMHLPPDTTAWGTFEGRDAVEGQVGAPPIDVDEEYPFTLDLRRKSSK